MSFYGGRSPGVFSAFGAGADPVSQSGDTPTSGTGQDFTSNLQPDKTDPTGDIPTTGTGQDFTSNLQPPLTVKFPWLLPLAFAGTAFVLLGGWSAIYYGRKKRGR